MTADTRTWERELTRDEDSACEYTVFDTNPRTVIDLVMMEGKAGLIPATVYIHAVFSQCVRLLQSVTVCYASLSHITSFNLVTCIAHILHPSSSSPLPSNNVCPTPREPIARYIYPLPSSALESRNPSSISRSIHHHHNDRLPSSRGSFREASTQICTSDPSSRGPTHRPPRWIPRIAC